MDARIGRQTEVVVGAEHDPLGALHLHHGAGGALQSAEVGQAGRRRGRRAAALSARARAPWRRRQWQSALVGSVSVSVVVRPVSGWRDRREFVELPYRLALYLRGLGSPAAAGAPHLPDALAERVLHARRRAALPGLARRARRRAHQRPVRRQLQRVPRQPLGHVRLPRARGRAGHPAADARGRLDLAAGPRARSHDRPDGLRHERRERRARSRASSACRSSSSRGTRPTTRRAARRPAWRRRWTS